MGITRSCHLLIAIACLATSLQLSAATVSGRVELHGPHRDLTRLRITLRFAGQFAPSSTLEAQRTSPAANGRFTLINVKPGLYVLQVDGPDILSAQWGGLGPELAGKTVVVHDGDDLRELTIPITTRPVLCGQVFDVNGKPLPHASVHAWFTDAAGITMSQGGSGVDTPAMGGNISADANGRYRFDHLATGYYQVGAYMPDHPDGTPSQEPFSGFWKYSAASQRGVPIAVTANGGPDVCAYNLHLSPLPKPYAGPRFRVSGKLDGSLDNPPVRGPVWNLQPLQGVYGDTASIATDVPFNPAHPVFAFDHVPPGRYKVTLGPPDVMEISGPCTPIQRIDAALEVKVTGDLVNLRVPVLPSASIEGSIVMEGALPPAAARSSNARYYLSLNGSSGCTSANTAADGSFRFTNLDPGDDHLSASIPLPGAYTASMDLNGKPAPGGALHLTPGVNKVRIVERFDSGTLDAHILSHLPDGLPAIDAHNNYAGLQLHVLLFDSAGHIVPTSVGVGHARFRGPLRPGRYRAIAGSNEQLTWTWADPRWKNERLLAAVAALGTAFEINPNQVTPLELTDHTVELQDLTAQLGIAMYTR